MFLFIQAVLFMKGEFLISLTVQPVSIQDYFVAFKLSNKKAPSLPASTPIHSCRPQLELEENLLATNDSFAICFALFMTLGIKNIPN